MYLDAFCSMLVYTLVTAAFFLLGASLLHESGSIPEGYAMVETLSRLFTVTLGPGAKAIFLLGAFFVLYSTLFSATASWSRMYVDALGHFGWAPTHSPTVHRRLLAILSWSFPMLWCALFLWLQVPVQMVLLGGLATSVLLFVVIWAALQFRYGQIPTSLQPSLAYDIWFWISVLSIAAVGIYGIWQLV